MRQSRKDEPLSPDQQEASFSGATSRDLAALAATVVVGLVLATLPHLIWAAETDDPTWFIDFDEAVYTTEAAASYHGDPTHLADLARPSGGHALFPWLSFVPFIAAAKALRLGPTGVILLWRVFAGLTIPAGWYLLARQHLERPAVAACASVILMSDCQAHTGLPLLRLADMLVGVTGGRSPWLDPSFGSFSYNYTWRVFSPGVILFFLLAHLTLLTGARERPTWLRVLASGVSFGALFYAYFYYWSAAGLALVLGVVLDRGRRWTYFHTGWIGGLVGLPVFVGNLMTKAATSPDTLARLDMFTPCDYAHRPPLFISRPETTLLVASLVYVLVRRRSLLPVWFLAAAGWLLVLQPVVTGLLLQEFHYRIALYGPTLSALVVIAATRELYAARPRLALVLVPLLAVAVTGAGAWSRVMDATLPRVTLEWLRSERSYRAQRCAPGAPRLERFAVVAGDEHFTTWAVIHEDVRQLVGNLIHGSPSVDTAEWVDREALNGYLLFPDRDDFAKETETILVRPLGPWAHDPSERVKIVDRLMEAYDAARADPQAALDRFRVRYLPLPAGTRPGSPEGWRLLESGPVWDVWQRELGPCEREPPHHQRRPRRADSIAGNPGGTMRPKP